MGKTIPKRSEVKKEDTWATEHIFESDAAWEQAYALAKEYPEVLSGYRGQLAASGETATMPASSGARAKRLIRP